MLLKKPVFVRRVCFLLLLAYGLLADPRMAWALGLSPVDRARHSCGVASCHCEHGPGAHAGTCCHAVADKLESKYPGMQAFMRRLQAQEDALPAGGTRIKPANCSTGSGDEVPAPGRPHLVRAPDLSLLPAMALLPAAAPTRLVRRPRGEALFKVPLI